MNNNINNTYTFNQFLSKEFVLFLKEEIKSLVANQKIAKRDRKSNVNHPCPEKRVYSTSEAYYRVQSNRDILNSLYNIYYFIRKNKNNIDWEKVSIHRSAWGVRMIMIDPSITEYRSLNNSMNEYYCGTFFCDMVEKYMSNHG